MTTKSPYRRPSLVQIERDGFKNSADTLAARVAQLESGGDDARIKELSAELDRLREIIETQHVQLTRQAHDLAHNRASSEDLDYYKKRVKELEREQNSILEILGHANCDDRGDYDY